MTVDDETYWIELREVVYAPKVAINLISLGTLMLQGYRLADNNNKHAVMVYNNVVMYVPIKQNVLVVNRESRSNEQAGGRT